MIHIFTWIFSTEQFSPVLSIWWCRQCGNDPQKDLAKFGYKLNMEVIFIKTTLLYFLLTTWSMFWNLVIFLKIWSHSGYWKYFKALDFSNFNFEYNFLAIYSQQKRLGHSLLAKVTRLRWRFFSLEMDKITVINLTKVHPIKLGSWVNLIIRWWGLD
jgi:hypothetical protein